MPIYSYECPKCGDFDFLQSIKELALRKCPTCNSSVKKLVTRFGFKLVGGNWPSKEIQVADAERLDKVLEKEENQLLSQGHTVFPKGTSREGEVI